jgi:hypothetical protein
MFNTVQEAIAFMKIEMLKGIKRGCSCPVCGKLQKLYNQQLTKEMVKGLLHLTQDYKVGEEFHIVDYFVKLGHPDIKSAADASIYKLDLWGLIEATEKKGIHVYTQKALDFINGKIMLPKYIETYNNVIVGESRDQLTIKGALKEDFNYVKLMGRLVTTP